MAIGTVLTKSRDIFKNMHYAHSGMSLLAVLGVFTVITLPTDGLVVKYLIFVLELAMAIIVIFTNFLAHLSFRFAPFF